MISTLKIAGLSALLSAGLVTGMDTKAPAPLSEKPFQDRLHAEPLTSSVRLSYAGPAAAPAIVTVDAGAKGDRLVPSCRQDASSGCQVGRRGAPATELRDELVTTSILVRTARPVATASR